MILLEVLGAALLVAGSALVLWVVVLADGFNLGAEPHEATRPVESYFKRAA